MCITTELNGKPSIWHSSQIASHNGCGTTQESEWVSGHTFMSQRQQALNSINFLRTERGYRAWAPSTRNIFPQ
jgi:hypothetical protein